MARVCPARATSSIPSPPPSTSAPDPLARFQRHLARRGMGPSVRQSRRDPRRRRLLGAQAVAEGRTPLTVRDVLTAMIKAHEIQGVLALENSFNRVGLDHVLLVRIASTAVATALLGGTREQIINALSNAWLDGGALRTYRHAPNTGSRKSWAAGDATAAASGTRCIALRGEMGYPAALSAPTWGFYDVLFRGQPVRARPLRQLRDGARAVQDLLPRRVPRADRRRVRHAPAPARRTDRLDEIERIEIDDTRTGRAHHRQDRPARKPRRPRPLPPVHDRHPLIFGRSPPTLRGRRRRRPAHRRAARANGGAREPAFTRDYFDPDKRSIANAVQVFFKDGSRHRRSTSSIRSAIAAAAPKVSRTGREVSRLPAFRFPGKTVPANRSSVCGSVPTRCHSGGRFRRALRAQLAAPPALIPRRT